MKKFYVQNVQNIDNYLLLTLRPRKQRDVLRFYPGQYATISFMVDGRPSPMRCFSMVSSPNNPNELQFAMRVEGNFTQAVQKLKVGTEIRLQGPYGEFVIEPEVDKNIIMMAGGIGITPFMSMLRYAAEVRLPIPITLLYAGRSQADIPFYEEIVELQKRNPRLRVVFYINDGKITPQIGVRMVGGRINQESLKQVTDGQYDQFTYFICGPDAFRSSLEQALANQQVDPDKVLTESFTQVSKVGGILGYSIPKLTYILSGFAVTGLIAFIMVLDLSRNVPRAAASAATTTTPTTSTSTPTSANSSPTTTTPTSNTTTTPTSTDSTPTTSNNNTYQAPVSSVS